MVDFLEEVFMFHMWIFIFTVIVFVDIGLLYVVYRFGKYLLEALI